MGLKKISHYKHINSQ